MCPPRHCRPKGAASRRRDDRETTPKKCSPSPRERPRPKRNRRRARSCSRRFAEHTGAAARIYRLQPFSPSTKRRRQSQKNSFADPTHRSGLRAGRCNCNPAADVRLKFHSAPREPLGTPGHSRRSALPDHQHRPRSPVRPGDRCRQSPQASLNEKNSATSAPAGETARYIPFSPMGAQKFFAFSARHRRRRRRCRQQARVGARPPLRRDCPPAGDRPSWSERAGRTSACSDRERPSAPLRPRR